MRRFLIISALLCTMTACGRPEPAVPAEIREEEEAVLIKDDGLDVILGDGTTELPLKFLDVSVAMAQPTERVTEPFPCQPDYFTPGDFPELTGERVKETGSPQSVVKTIKGKRVEVRLFVEDQILGVAMPPFEVWEYTFTEVTDPYASGCISHAIQIRKDGKHHALYSHIQHDGAAGADWMINPTMRQLMVHNRRADGTRWIEQTRMIDMETKDETVFPLDECYILPYLRPDGSLVGGFADYTDFGESGFCSMNPDGTLIAKLHPVGVGGSTFPRPYVDANKKLFAFTDFDGHISGHMQGSMPIVVVNIESPKQWAVLRFELPDGVCDPFEYDLSNFTFDNPKLRVRWTEDPQPCMGQGTSLSEWMTVPSHE